MLTSRLNLCWNEADAISVYHHIKYRIRSIAALGDMQSMQHMNKIVSEQEAFINLPPLNLFLNEMALNTHKPSCVTNIKYIMHTRLDRSLQQRPPS